MEQRFYGEDLIVCQTTKKLHRFCGFKSLPFHKEAATYAKMNLLHVFPNLTYYFSMFAVTE